MAKKKQDPYNAVVMRNNYGFAKTFRRKPPISISIFCNNSKISIYNDISSLFAGDGFSGTLSDLKDGYEFSASHTADYDSAWCYICEDAQDFVKQLVKCGLPKEPVLDALSKCSSGDEALMGLIDSLNEAFQEMADSNSELTDSSSQADDNDETELETQEAPDLEGSEESEKTEHDQAVTMEQIKKRFDALYKEVKKKLPGKTKSEEIRAEAFRLLKEEFPAELEDVEME